MDQAYKLEILPYYTALTHKTEGAKITFSLTRFLSSHIGASDV